LTLPDINLTISVNGKVVSFNRILDMVRTVINVLGNALAAVVIQSGKDSIK
jgi:Na+/H+-dicarboxylate symporter